MVDESWSKKIPREGAQSEGWRVQPRAGFALWIELALEMSAAG